MFDWNRTIHPDKSDMQLHAKIGQRILIETILDSRRHPYNRGLRTLELGIGGIELTGALRRFKQGKLTLEELNSIYNRRFICGQKTQVVERVIEEYAQKCARELDLRVLNAIKETRNGEIRVAILSASIDVSIEKTLRAAKIREIFDQIIANRIITEGEEALGITSRIYGDKKGEMERYSRENGIQLDNIVYMGDCEDDAQIAPLLRRGSFIVSFAADEEFKSKMAKEGAFIPESEKELTKYLKER